jgi:ketosteroid isomerase-like protein
MTKTMMKRALACALILPGAAQADPLPPSDPLYQQIAQADAALFAATNRCDLDTLAGYIADDLEFYHDKSGLSVGKADLLQKTKDNICGNMVRELVPGSLEVHPLPGYGAIEIGTHRFLHPKEPGNIGQARFIHLWQRKDGAWKLSRVISYDH